MTETLDHSEMINAHLGGFNRAMGLSFVRATADEVVAELTVGPAHTQPYGLVHGGVYAGMIETLGSTGAAIWAGAQGLTTVGLENSTSFLRATRSGKLRGRGVPLARGQRTQVWQVEIVDEQERLVASGRVRLVNLPPGARAAGETVALEPDAAPNPGSARHG